MFSDLTKAFDWVEFDSLFYKLNFIGARDIPLSWIKSYFVQRNAYSKDLNEIFDSFEIKKFEIT